MSEQPIEAVDAAAVDAAVEAYIDDAVKDATTPEEAKALAAQAAKEVSAITVLPGQDGAAFVTGLIEQRQTIAAWTWRALRDYAASGEYSQEASDALVAIADLNAPVK